MTKIQLGSAGSKVKAAAALAVVHVFLDVISEATCPKCGMNVVLYVCVNCPGLVWPKRQLRST